MADKEATVYIIDLGKSMGEKRNGRKETNLEWAMKYVWEKITTTVAMERKTATLGVVGFRTDATNNELDSEESFEHISVLQEIGQLLLPGLKELRQSIYISTTDDGDAISAIVVAIQLITKYTKRLKYKRKIVLVTDGRGSLDDDPEGLAEISKKIKADEMELVVLGVDFDDPEYGFKEESKDSKKLTNERTLKTLVDDCGGVIGTMQEAIEELGVPRLKSVRPVNSYKGQLTLGDPDQYDSALCIDVERYPRVSIRRPLTASRFIKRTDASNDHASPQSSAMALPDADSNGMASVRNVLTYQVADAANPGVKKEISRDDLAKGFEYGRTAVYISESDLNFTKLETQAGLEIIGFIPWQTVSSISRIRGLSDLYIL